MAVDVKDVVFYLADGKIVYKFVDGTSREVWLNHIANLETTETWASMVTMLATYNLELLERIEELERRIEIA